MKFSDKIQIQNCSVTVGESMYLVNPECPHCRAVLQSPRLEVKPDERGRCPRCEGRFTVSAKGSLVPS